MIATHTFQCYRLNLYKMHDMIHAIIMRSLDYWEKRLRKESCSAMTGW